MKIYLCVIIVFFCGLIGVFAKDKINKKIEFYNEIYMFLQYITIKIAFFKDTYSDCIESFINTNTLKNKHFFNSLLQLIKNGQLTKEQCYSIMPQELLQTEKQEIFLMISQIGSTDILGQSELLAGFKEQIKVKIDSACKYKKTKVDVFAKLMICAGIVICILVY